MIPERPPEERENEAPQVVEVTIRELTHATKRVVDLAVAGRRVIVTRRGRPVAVLVGVEQLLDLLVRPDGEPPLGESEALAELLGPEVERRWRARERQALAHWRFPEPLRAPSLSGPERRRREAAARARRRGDRRDEPPR